MRDHIRMPEKVAIIGLGQMGGSLAKALKKRSLCAEVIGWTPFEEELQTALACGAIDSGSTNAEEVLKEADLTILCAPVDPLIDFVKTHAGHFRKGSVVTDISSVKSLIVDKVRPVLLAQGVHFIGSHPMAGNEKSGLENTNADLYEKTVMFICPFSTDDPAAINIVRELWREIGAIPYEVDAIEHDEALAATSHMLHITASVAAHIALEGNRYELASIACAGSFRDTTRIAASDPRMWRNITAANKTAVIKAMDRTLDEIARLRNAIAAEDYDEIEDYLEKGKVLRERWWKDYNELKN